MSEWQGGDGGDGSSCWDHMWARQPWAGDRQRGPVPEGAPELAAAEDSVRDTLEPSGFWNVACALALLPAPLPAQINTWALIIKWLIVLAGLIEAAIYRVAVLPNPPDRGTHFWQVERQRLRPRVSKRGPFQPAAN